MYSRPIHHLSTLLRCVQKMILKNGKNNSDFYMYHRYNKPDVVGTKEEIIELLKSEMAYLNKDWNNEDFVADLFADNEYLHLIDALIKVTLKHLLNIILPQRAKMLLLLVIVAMMGNT